MRVPLTQRVRFGWWTLVTSTPGLGRQALCYHLFRLGALMVVGVVVVMPFQFAAMTRAWERHELAPSAATRDRVERAEASTVAGVIVGVVGGALGVVTYPGYRRHELLVYHGRTRALRMRSRASGGET